MKHLGTVFCRPGYAVSQPLSEVSHSFSRTARGRPRRQLLSLPTPCRSTPIATTALRFSIYLDTEGVRDVQVFG